MKTKWFFGFVIAVLTLIGTQQEYGNAHNQTIIVQFNAKNLTADAVEATIIKLKQDLKIANASNIKVSYLTNNSLKISYHSQANTTHIKQRLVNASTQKQKLPYSLDVFEIDALPSNDVNGLSVEVFQQKTDRLQDAKTLHFTAYGLRKNYANRFQNITVSHYFLFSKQHFNYKIPEVRAGPTALTIA